MLIITDFNQERREALAELYHYMGVLTLAVSPNELKYSIDPGANAILFASIDGIDARGDMLREIRMYTDLPIFAITDTVISGFERTFSNSDTYPDILHGIREYGESHKSRAIGDYERCGISVSAFTGDTSFLGEPLPLTKSEIMILRYIIAIYPRPASAEGILRYAFRASRSPEISGVRTHLSVMNKKFREAFGRCLITSDEREGYRLSLSNDDHTMRVGQRVAMAHR